MQTLSLFSTPLFTNKQAPTFKASAASEAGIPPLPTPRLQHDTVSFAPKVRSGISKKIIGEVTEEVLTEVFSPYYDNNHFYSSDYETSLKLLDEELKANNPNLPDKLQPRVRLREYLPPEYLQEGEFILTREDNPSLKLYRTALEEIEAHPPSINRDSMLQFLLTESEIKALGRLNAKILPEERDREFSAKLLNGKIESNNPIAPIIQKFRQDHSAWLQKREEAEQKLIKERMVQEFCTDWNNFDVIVSKLRIRGPYEAILGKRFRIKQRIGGSSEQWREQHATFFRRAGEVVPNEAKYPWSLEQRPLYTILEEAFAEKRKVLVRKVKEASDSHPQELELWLKTRRLIRA